MHNKAVMRVDDLADLENWEGEEDEAKHEGNQSLAGGGGGGGGGRVLHNDKKNTSTNFEFWI